VYKLGYISTGAAMWAKNFADILGIGTVEFLAVLIIIILLFWGKKLPRFATKFWSSLKLRLRGKPKAGNDNNENTSKTK
jgi:Sec-independent protein translocase protein TatA